MPFRTNAFSDPIAQPGTTFSEIDNAIINRWGYFAADPWSADVFPDGDDDFKFGGCLYLSAESEESDDGPEQVDVEISFDGFETKADAIDWLIQIGLTLNQIQETN